MQNPLNYIYSINFEELSTTNKKTHDSIRCYLKKSELSQLFSSWVHFVQFQTRPSDLKIYVFSVVARQYYYYFSKYEPPTPKGAYIFSYILPALFQRTGNFNTDF